VAPDVGAGEVAGAEIAGLGGRRGLQAHVLGLGLPHVPVAVGQG